MRDWYPAVSDDELARIGDFVRSYTGSALAARIAGLDGVRPERPFAFELDGVLVNGRLDVLWLEGGRALVLDYKTNALLGRDPAEIVAEEYLTQQVVYAIACLRAGAAEVEVVYHFLEDPDAVVSTTYTAADAVRLEEGLSASIARIRAGEFRPTPSAFACSGCPALDVVCAGPRLGGSDDGAFEPGTPRASSLRAVRVAALYDIHGNLPALEAVLADPRCVNADVIVCGGDLVAGPNPAACFDRLDALGSRVRFVRGNGDRNAVEHDETHGGAWCAAALGPERLAAVAAWPLTVDLDVTGGATFCHATLRSDDEIVTRLTPDDELEQALAAARGALVVCGHTHVQVDRRLAGGRRLVNAGSVGRPYEGVRGAFWALLGDDVGLLRTDYDVEEAASAIRASGYPDAEDHATQLLDPPSADEVSAYFESLRGA